MFSKENKVVNKGLKVRLYPDGDLASALNQNIGNARFTWNHLLKEYQDTFNLFKQHGYKHLRCNWKTFNAMLNMLKKEYPFLYEGESSSLQQVWRDLIQAFKRFFNGQSNYPKIKNKKNPKSFRIQNNNNNIKIKDNTIVLPKIGKVFYRTSTFYKKLLQESKINNVTIKKEHGYYYAVFNIETEITEFDKTSDSIGIDLGIRNLATLSNGLKIANLDTSYEDKMIKKYYRKLSKKQYNSNRYNKTLKTLGKWINKKKNRLKDAYHKISLYLVKNYDIICMETLDIKKMFQNKDLSTQLQSIGLYQLVEMIKYKCKWYGKKLIQISQWFPSSKKCSKCGYIHKDLKDEKEWTCPHCKTHNDRDINAAKNIELEGLRIFLNDIMNLWDRGDSTVILFSVESTSP